MAAPRAISSGTISFGLVSIPVKVYTAATSQSVRFNMLHAECGSRIKQQMVCPVCEVVVSRGDTIKGYEYAKNQYVQFDAEELKKLEAEKTNTIDIVEFVPLDSVDLIQIDRSYYLGPDKGGQKAYKLLSGAMDRTERVAVGRHWTRGKEQLVLIRPYREGLLMHQVYYADEVRDFADIDVGDEVKFKPGEPDLADQLIEQLSSERFEAEKYRDEYRDRVVEAVEQKVAGEEVTVAPEQPTAQIIDLFEALKASIDQGEGSGKKAASKKPGSGEEPSKTKAASKSASKGTTKGKSAKKGPKKAREKAKGVRKVEPKKAGRGKSAKSG